MNGKKVKLRLLLIGFALCIATLLGMAWCVNKTVAWVRELPSRIEIQIDGEVFGAAITESIRSELQNGAIESQLSVIEYLSHGITESPESQTWIQNEYGEEIAALANSADPEVASAATQLAKDLQRNKQSELGH